MVISPDTIVAPKFLIMCLALVGLSSCTAGEARWGEATPSAGPALWTISDEDTTIHLFGTAPVVRTGSEWQNDAILTALDEADLVVIESDGSTAQAQSAVQALIPQIGFNRDGSTLSSKLNDDQRAEVNAVSTGLGAPISVLDSLRPWLASVQIGVLYISRGDFDLANPPADQLTTRAANAGATIEPLENATDLMRVMANFSEETQIAMLLHSARAIRDQPDQQKMIANAWLAGDVETVAELLHGDERAWPNEAVYDALVVTRNETWRDRITTLMAEHDGTVFFTAGLGHFAGKDSLIAMLEADGFDVVRR